MGLGHILGLSKWTVNFSVCNGQRNKTDEGNMPMRKCMFLMANLLENLIFSPINMLPPTVDYIQIKTVATMLLDILL